MTPPPCLEKDKNHARKLFHDLNAKKASPPKIPTTDKITVAIDRIEHDTLVPSLAEYKASFSSLKIENSHVKNQSKEFKEIHDKLTHENNAFKEENRALLEHRNHLMSKREKLKKEIQEREKLKKEIQEATENAHALANDLGRERGDDNDSLDEWKKTSLNFVDSKIAADLCDDDESEGTSLVEDDDERSDAADAEDDFGNGKKWKYEGEHLGNLKNDEDCDTPSSNEAWEKIATNGPMI